MLPDTAHTPATPRRATPMQALSGLFRTPTRLRTPTTVSRRNKRPRPRTSSLSSTSSTPSTPSLPAVVLQTYSVSTDSIVLTALPSAPFCCHEDLVTMSRAQLEAVVRALNVRLPRRMRIGPEDDFWQSDRGLVGERDNEDDGLSGMSEVEMRRRVEELVGIRAVAGNNRVSRSALALDTRSGVPPAPKAVRTRDAAWRPSERAPWEMETDAAEEGSDDSSIMIDDSLMGSSPLASRTMSGLSVRRRSNTLPPLGILQEENEGDDSKEDGSGNNETRPSKRQRLSLEGVAPDAEEGSQIVFEVGESRMIENMDLSGSPLLARDDAESSWNNIERDGTVTTTTIILESAERTLEETTHAPLQRRRSTRIKEIAIKRNSSVDAGKKATANAMGLKSSFLGSRTLSRRSSQNNFASAGSEARLDAVPPQEFTIRLPFTPTPLQEKPDSAWSAPRILRRHSQRLLDASQSTRTKASLGRSQSVKYPRTQDMVFVTLDRPRYRFARRKSNGAKVANGDQASRPSSPPTPEHSTCQPRQGHRISAQRPNELREHEKENEDPMSLATSSVVANLHTLPSALCSLLVPRARAPSTSTVASTHGNYGDSPARTVAQEEAALATTTDSTVTERTTDYVWEALERMAVDSV